MIEYYTGAKVVSDFVQPSFVCLDDILRTRNKRKREETVRWVDSRFGIM